MKSYFSQDILQCCLLKMLRMSCVMVGSMHAARLCREEEGPSFCEMIVNPLENVPVIRRMFNHFAADADVKLLWKFWEGPKEKISFRNLLSRTFQGNGRYVASFKMRWRYGEVCLDCHEQTSFTTTKIKNHRHVFCSVFENPFHLVHDKSLAVPDCWIMWIGILCLFPVRVVLTRGGRIQCIVVHHVCVEYHSMAFLMPSCKGI